MNDFTYSLEPIQNPVNEEKLTISPIDLKTEIICLAGVKEAMHIFTIPSLNIAVIGETYLDTFNELQQELTRKFLYLCRLDDYRRNRDLQQLGWEKLKLYNRRFVRPANDNENSHGPSLQSRILRTISQNN